MNGPLIAFSGAILLVSAAFAGSLSAPAPSAPPPPSAAAKPGPQAAPAITATPAPQGGMGVSHSSSPGVFIIPSKTVGYREPFFVPAGTPITLRISEDLVASERQLRPGDRIRLEVADPVPLHPHLKDSLAVVPSYTPALGEVVQVRHAGRSGKVVTVRLLHVTLGRIDFALRGQASVEARLGARLNGSLGEDIVPPQALVPIQVPIMSEARLEPYYDPSKPAPAAPPPPRAFIVAPARPRTELAALISAMDYPASALRAREEGIVAFMLDVGENGRVTGCMITRSSESSALDATTCRLMQRRARFTPARDSNGNPAPSRLDQHVTWTLPPAP